MAVLEGVARLSPRRPLRPSQPTKECVPISREEGLGCVAEYEPWRLPATLPC